jgi:acyl-CoA thioesterase-1
MQRLLLACLFLSLTGSAPAWSQAAQPQAGTPLECAIPPDLTTPSAPLNRFAAAITAKKNVEILALGSGSTVGESGGSGGQKFHTPEQSFPYKMVEALRGMKPGVRFNLTVKGGRSMTAESMLPILRQELMDHHYDLVLWQTGTVEAVQGMRPDALRGVLQDGADAAEEAQADLVLIDPQYSRFLRANADLNPYETVLDQLTNSSAATLFHRFDLTQSWVDSGQVDLERVNPDQRDKAIALLNDCLGQALAKFVLAGAEAH